MSVQIRGNPKVNLRLNSWILRCAQYDKKSVQYDKIYKYDKASQYDKFGALLKFL